MVVLQPQEEAIGKRFGMRRTWAHERVRAGLLPPPIHVNRSALWPAHELDAVAIAMIGNATDDQLRALVADLVARRAACEIPTDNTLRELVAKHIAAPTTEESI